MQDVFISKMTDFEKRRFEIEEVLLLLEPYTDGELSFLLNATENIDIVNDDLIAFDMEDAAKKTAGVKDATVNFMTLKMNVEFEEGQDPTQVMQVERENCKKVEDDCEIFL